MTHVLDDVEAFLARFVAYPSDAARVAHVAWIGHTWFMDQWDSTPRIAFLSPEPGSGKSRALEVTEPLVPRPVHAVNTTPAYLFRKVSDPEGAPTILFDEIDTVFGPKAKDNEDLRGMLNAGHRRGAMAGRCVVKGKVVETEELPAYCAVALAGLNDMPDTLMSRSVVVRMRRRGPSERVEPWRHRLNAPEADPIARRLAGWAVTEAKNAVLTSEGPDMPAGVEDRNADIWEALLAVADLAGGAWPARAREAAVSLVTESQAGAPTLGVLLLRDLQAAFDGRDKLATEAVLDALHAMDESPWSSMHGKPIDSRWLSRQLGKYDIKPKVMRLGAGTLRGYEAADLTDAWSRYLPREIPETVTPVTSAGPGVTSSRPAVTPAVTPVTPVTHPERVQEAAVTPATDPLRKVRDTHTPPPEETRPPLPGRKSVTDVTDVTPTKKPSARSQLPRCQAAMCSAPLKGKREQLDGVCSVHITCQGCGFPMNPVVVISGESVHPTCQASSSTSAVAI